MVSDNQKTGFFKVFFSLFPFHLLLALFYWIFLFLIVSDWVGAAFGTPLLFLFTWIFRRNGILVLSFHGYRNWRIYHGFRHLFIHSLSPAFLLLNTLHQPFFKFCLNNGILPVLFNMYFIYRFCYFQMDQEYDSIGDVMIFSSSYIFGFFLFQILSVVYFFPMNKRVSRKLGAKFVWKRGLHELFRKPRTWENKLHFCNAIKCNLPLRDAHGNTAHKSRDTAHGCRFTW